MTAAADRRFMRSTFDAPAFLFDWDGERWASDRCAIIPVPASLLPAIEGLDVVEFLIGKVRPAVDGSFNPDIVRVARDGTALSHVLTQIDGADHPVQVLDEQWQSTRGGYFELAALRREADGQRSFIQRRYLAALEGLSLTQHAGGTPPSKFMKMTSSDPRNRPIVGRDAGGRIRAVLMPFQPEYAVEVGAPT